MTAPRLLLARPNGQSSVRAIFDQPMRQLGQDAQEDPTNPAVWSVGGGLPAIDSVIRVSNLEFELVLVSPAPVAAGYTITVAETVSSAATGETMDPAFTSATFNIDTPDLVITQVSWLSNTEINIQFSEPIAQILFDEFADVATFRTIDHSAREPSISGISQSGASFRISLENAGTAGARYNIALNREVFVSDATNVTLLAGQENQLAWGQGQAPALIGLDVSEDDLEATSSEVLGSATGTQGWPLSHAFYAVDSGSLTPSEPLELGGVLDMPSVLSAPSASFKGLVGQPVNFFLKKSVRQLQTGQSFIDAASSVVGDGTETVGFTTFLNKTAGNPFELVFSGGQESLVRAGRRLKTDISIVFTASANEFALAAFTFLNNQVSVVIEKTENNQAVLRLYRGNLKLDLVSREFDPTIPFTFEILDATAEEDGFLAVAINEEVLIGAKAKDLDDPLLVRKNVGTNALAVTLGSPLAPAETFTVDFRTDLIVQSYPGTGLLGLDSRDLFDFDNAALTVNVNAAIDPPLSPGYEGTGKAAFGVHAEFMPNLAGNAISAIQVVIGLNNEAQPSQFTGTVTLLTGNESVLDQIVLDESYVLVGGDETIVVFLNPPCWAGTLVDVAINISGTDYSTTVPVIEIGQPEIVAQLAPQPSKWGHYRLSNLRGSANLAKFGPAVIIQTP